MCYFITLGIPESASDFLQEEARPEMSAWRCENKDIMVHLNMGYHGYVLTTGMCSCDLYHRPLRDETPEDTARRLQKKYNKKGWSDVKIQRAISDATAAEKPHLRGLRSDARKLIARVATASKRVYVYVHWFNGDQTTEKIDVKQGPEVSSVDFGSGAYVVETDTLIIVNGQNLR